MLFGFRAAPLYSIKLCSLELKTAMARRVTQGLLFVQDENEVALCKSTIFFLFVNKNYILE